jgi:hypothetical protein
MALENIVSKHPSAGRWAIAFGFGLVHGFGFSFVLAETMQFAGDHLLFSLVAFNAGVELGQLLVLVVLVPALGALFRYVVDARMGTIVLSAFVAHTAWHWTVERWAELRQFPLPRPDAAFYALFFRWLTGAILVFALIRIAHAVRARLFPQQPEHAERHHGHVGD